MPILVIDTSTERGLVAIVSEDKLVFFAQLPFGLQNAQRLFPELQRGLASSGFILQDFSLIAVCIGPGSYTGIRVGAIAAKTLALTAKKPLVGLCTLSGFIPNQEGLFSAVIDAKIGGIYWQKGELKQGLVHWLEEPQVSPLEMASSLLADCQTLVTPNATLLRPKLLAVAPHLMGQWQEIYPSPLYLAALAQKKFLAGDFSSDTSLELLYLRKTQAEIERNK